MKNVNLWPHPKLLIRLIIFFADSGRTDVTGSLVAFEIEYEVIVMILKRHFMEKSLRLE